MVVTPPTTSPTEQAVEPKVYKIPEVNFTDLKAKIAKLAKRAEKLGVEPPTLTVVETVDEPEIQYPEVYVDYMPGALAPEPRPTGRVLRFYLVTVTGEAPKFAGWSLAAVIELDHEEGRPAEEKAPNIVHVLPGVTAEPGWRTQGDWCDHCKVANRGRAKLVIVDHDEGDRRLVGTTCLKDFLGHQAPTTVAQWATYVEALDISDYESYDAEDRAWSTGETRYDTVAYLAWVQRATVQSGWVSRGEARFDGGLTATADAAVELLLLANGVIKPARNEVRPAPLTDDEIAFATAALAWAEEIEPTNDYLANVNAVALKVSLRASHLGIAASIIPAYSREIEREIRRKLEAESLAGSVHFGKVKERLVLTGTVLSVRYIDSHYGTKALVKILTTDGNVAVWWASDASNAPQQGDEVTGKATVKEHGEFGGVAETTVLRYAFEVTAGPSFLPCGDKHGHQYNQCSCFLYEVEGVGKAYTTDPGVVRVGLAHVDPRIQGYRPTEITYGTLAEGAAHVDRYAVSLAEGREHLADMVGRGLVLALTGATVA